MNPKEVFLGSNRHVRARGIFLPGLLLIFAAAACSPSASGTPGAAPAAGGSSSGDPKAAVLRAIAAHLTAGPYRVEATFTSGATATAMHGEVILPDRFHLFSSINGGPEREYIIVGSDTYVNMGGRWNKIALDLSGMLAGIVNNMDPSKISDVRLAGPEDVGGTATMAYTFTYTDDSGAAPITNSDKMWIGVDSGLPVKQVVEGESGGTAYRQEQTIHYDPAVSIEAPALS